MEKDSNNLNALRLFAALLVLYGHSFVFLGLKEPLFLSWLPLGPLGVYIFFSISGYLVAQSWKNDPNLFRFFVRRILRIFPGLAVCVVLVSMVVGPLVTTLTLLEYFTNLQTWSYLKTIGLYIHHYLPGVFTKNTYPGAVNGSLWSLPVEFLMYIMLATTAFVLNKKWIYLAVAVVSFLVTHIWAWQTEKMLVFYGQDIRQVFICGTYFWAGVVLFQFDLKKYFSITTVMLSTACLIFLEPWPHISRSAAMVLIPIVTLAFGLSYSVLARLTKRGDYSYGIYIYAFPVQQTVAHYYPKMDLVPYLVVCALLIIPISVLSWHFIENPSLKLKAFLIRPN